MLNSFWNLCRVCPSMPIDKLNSEYRTHFKWHDTYHTPIHEAIRRTEGPAAAICSEPAIPRRKKHPELAYRTHEVLRMVNGGESSDSLDTADSAASRDAENRARSEERNQNRNRTSPRSKSVDPYLGRKRPWSVHVPSKGAGFWSSKNPVEHRIQYPRRQWNTTTNPGHHVEKLMTQSYPPVVHVPLPTTTTNATSSHQRPPSRRPPGPTAPPPPPSSPTVAGGRRPKTTEYRSQFAWPPNQPPIEQAQVQQPAVHHQIHHHQEAAAPRKSISMGAIQAAQQGASGASDGQAGRKPPANQRGDEVDGNTARKVEALVVKGTSVGVQESVVVSTRGAEREAAGLPTKQVEEDLVAANSASGKPKKFKTEYKAKFKPPSKYVYMDGGWKKMSRSADSAELQKEVSVTPTMPWYGEVMELRKKAGEYKCRSIGGNMATETLSEIFSRQEICEQLTSRSTLSALALATTPSTFKKNKGVDGGELCISGGSSRPQSSVRHHLERTTPTSGETGVLITSPTRDHKLEPVQIQKTTESPGKSKSSGVAANVKPSFRPETQIVPSKAPTSLASSAHGPSAQTRSSSVGPHRSPKRTPRPMSMIVPGTKAQVNGVYNGSGGTDQQPPPQQPPRKTETKRPRPTSLATSAASPTRPKTAPVARSSKPAQSSDPSDTLAKTHARSTAAAGVHAAPSSQTRAAHRPATATASTGPSSAPSKAQAVTRPTQPKPAPAPTEEPKMVNGEEDTNFDKLNNYGSDEEDSHRSRGGPVRSESEEIEETIMMKSPPEPTRVKSPEQILVRSPEPVKWTIPLETGIKWTGATKIEGDVMKLSREEPRSPPSIASPVESAVPTIPTQPIELTRDFIEKLTEKGDTSLEGHQEYGYSTTF